MSYASRQACRLGAVNAANVVRSNSSMNTVSQGDTHAYVASAPATTIMRTGEGACIASCCNILPVSTLQLITDLKVWMYHPIICIAGGLPLSVANLPPAS